MTQAGHVPRSPEQRSWFRVGRVSQVRPTTVNTRFLAGTAEKEGLSLSLSLSVSLLVLPGRPETAEGHLTTTRGEPTQEKTEL